MGGLKCKACRRFVLGRWHITLLIVVAVVAVIGLLEVLNYLTPPPIKK
ncbi:MAG TPA: hypothetical protein VN282_00145 [Pyrinomonadaceae bacterium]|nr:hypothetical protein [Pyrinomonadaceae bacterium]